MNISQIKQVAVVDFLEAIGIRPTKETPFSAWYHAPYREDNSPSFKVNKKRNLWYDFATGQNGDIIDLGALLYHTADISRVLKQIEAAAPAIPVRTRTTLSCDENQSSAQTFQDIEIKPLSSPALKAYLLSRGIDTDIGETYCREVHYTLRQKKYYALAFPNARGGYEMRNPYYKGCMAPKDISVISSGGTTGACCLFEGFMDFLSYCVMTRRKRIEPFCTDCDCIVMNSTSLVSKALPLLKRYKEIHCYLDNDDAGRRVVDLLAEMKGKAVHDEMAAYPLYKDMNDRLRDKKRMP